MNRLLKSALICSLATLPLCAAIYMRIKGNPREAISAAGATEVARHEALVNGYRATLSVLVFDEPIESAIERIRSVAPDFPPLKAGRVPYLSGAWVSSSDDETGSDIFFMPGLNDEGHCSAWLVEKDATQTAAEPMPGFNPLPDATLASWIFDKTQGTLMSVHDSDADPESAFADALAAMKREDWIPVATGATTAMLVKDDYPATITAYPTATGTRTAIVRHL